MNQPNSILLRRQFPRLIVLAGLLGMNLKAQVTNAPLVVPPFPEASVSLLRVTGALALVIGIFLGGVWLFKNWQRIACQRRHQARLNILETRSLGPRQAIFVVAYEQQRFLISTSSAGINLLTHLPDGEAPVPGAEPPAAPMPFAQALAQVLKGK